jgi:protein-S-isoprenylcysteine O-methyltransferase Ste14
MRKAFAIVGSAVFLVIAPGFVAGLAPWWISHWRAEAPLMGMPLFRLAGCMLIALGAGGLLDSFVRFALQGLGTPAPVFPTSHLVVTCLYRYVRNPMYVAVVSAILGQGLVFGNTTLLEYGGLVWLLFHLFVLIYEEPTLEATFGSEYKSFHAANIEFVHRAPIQARNQIARSVPQFVKPFFYAALRALGYQLGSFLRALCCLSALRF